MDNIDQIYLNQHGPHSTYGSSSAVPTQKHCDEKWKLGENLATLDHASRPTKSLFRVAHLIDYIWPQFYPSPAEITMSATGTFKIEKIKM